MVNVLTEIKWTEFRTDLTCRKRNSHKQLLLISVNNLKHRRILLPIVNSVFFFFPICFSNFSFTPPYFIDISRNFPRLYRVPYIFRYTCVSSHVYGSRHVYTSFLIPSRTREWDPIRIPRRVRPSDSTSTVTGQTLNFRTGLYVCLGETFLFH